MRLTVDTLGGGLFTLVYVLDVYATTAGSLRRRSRQIYNEFVSRTDLFGLDVRYPPAAGGTEPEPPTPENYRNVVLVGYGVALLFVTTAILDASEATPPCFPYHGVVNTYGRSIAVATVALLFFSEGQHVTVPYHAPIRFLFGLVPPILTVYAAVCTGGPL